MLIYGQGVYHYDTVPGAATAKGTDIVTLVICSVGEASRAEQVHR